MIHIKKARSEQEIEAVRALFEDYLHLLKTDYQNACGYAQGVGEMKDFPDNHAELFMAFKEDRPVAACGLKHVNAQDIELVRLYCRPEARGEGVGRKLLDACRAYALDQKYKRLVLSTEPVMQAAIQLYKSYGFKEVSDYRSEGTACSKFMALDL